MRFESLRNAGEQDAIDLEGHVVQGELERKRAFIRTPGTQLYDPSERELISEILYGSSRLYEFFGFVMTDVHDMRSEDGWGYLFYGNVPRIDLGLPQHGQPGDIDVLIVPHRDGSVHLSKAAAVEVKRLSLKGPRWDKSSDRYGITQANGLLEAGFPYAGVLHLIVHADGPKENWQETLTYRVVDREDHAVFEEQLETDMTGWRTAERQLGRLLAQQPNPAIGLNCVWLADFARPSNEGVLVGMPNGRPATLNPRASRTCLEGVAAFMRRMKSDVMDREVDGSQV